MNFENILNKSIDERTLSECVFIPILESTAKDLPFVSIESRIAIESYIVDSISKDLSQIKLEFESLDRAHSKVLEEIHASDSDNLDASFKESEAAILKISSLLNLKLPQISIDISLQHNKRILGEGINKSKDTLNNLKYLTESIDSCYKGARGHLGDAMSKSSSSSSKGYSHIKEQLTSVKDSLNKFKTKLEEPARNNLGISNKKTDVIKGIWVNFLIDAISLLKINDKREKVYIERKENKGELLSIFDVFNKIRRTSSYGVEEIAGYFDDFIDYESVLYGMSKHYRDHKKHVLQVWALGIILINELHKNDSNITLNDEYVTTLTDFQFLHEKEKNGTEKEQEEKEKNGFITKSELWAMWIIIAFCHDLGYPIEKTSQINKQAKKILTHFGSMQFTELDYNFSTINSHSFEKFLNIVSSKVQAIKEDEYIYKTTVQEKHKDKLSKSLEDYKHGIFSSLLLYKNLTYFQETDYSSGKGGKLLSEEDARQFYIRKEILRSIAGHTCPKLYHIRLDTLAFLLILCDELQEWNRPKAENLLHSAKEIIPIVKIEKFDLNKDTDSIVISMFYDTSSTEDLIKYLVISRFKNIHYLLRSGKDDNDRGFMFTWTIKFKDIVYELRYDSNKFSYELLVVESFTEETPDKRTEISLYD